MKATTIIGNSFNLIIKPESNGDPNPPHWYNITISVYTAKGNAEVNSVIKLDLTPKEAKKLIKALKSK